MQVRGIHMLYVSIARIERLQCDAHNRISQIRKVTQQLI